MLNFSLEDLGVKHKNVILLVTEDLFYSFVKHVPLKGKGKNAGLQYYLEARSDVEREEWLTKP